MLRKLDTRHDFLGAHDLVFKKGDLIALYGPYLHPFSVPTEKMEFDLFVKNRVSIKSSVGGILMQSTNPALFTCKETGASVLIDLASGRPYVRLFLYGDYYKETTPYWSPEARVAFDKDPVAMAVPTMRRVLNGVANRIGLPPDLKALPVRLTKVRSTFSQMEVLSGDLQKNSLNEQLIVRSRPVAAVRIPTSWLFHPVVAHLTLLLLRLSISIYVGSLNSVAVDELESIEKLLNLKHFSYGSFQADVEVVAAILKNEKTAVLFNKPIEETKHLFGSATGLSDWYHRMTLEQNKLTLSA